MSLFGTPLFGHRDGVTYDADVDFVRLNRQAMRVWRVMVDGAWRTLEEISVLSGSPPQSVSARLRDFRKRFFGGHTVLRRRRSAGLHEYQLRPNPRIKIARRPAKPGEGKCRTGYSAKT